LDGPGCSGRKRLKVRCFCSLLGFASVRRSPLSAFRLRAGPRAVFAQGHKLIYPPTIVLIMALPSLLANFGLTLLLIDDARSASPAVLLSLTRIFLELALYEGALEILQVVFAQDDEEVEAWYLQGWCFVLMAEQVKEGGLKLEELGWEELAQDARDCLETCRGVSDFPPTHIHPQPLSSTRLDKNSEE
jgi:hypothetical protein